MDNKKNPAVTHSLRVEHLPQQTFRHGGCVTVYALVFEVCRGKWRLWPMGLNRQGDPQLTAQGSSLSGVSLCLCWVSASTVIIAVPFKKKQFWSKWKRQKARMWKPHIFTRNGPVNFLGQSKWKMAQERSNAKFMLKHFFQRKKA